MKKIILYITPLLILFSINIQGVEVKKESEWSERGDLLKVIPKTQWHFKIQNKIREDAILTLRIIEDEDINSTKTPVLKLEATPQNIESAIKEINLPASYHIQVERKQGNCKWDFTPGSLLRSWSDNFLFVSTDPKCGQATGTMKLEFDKNTKTGELIFTLTDVEETQIIKELN